MLINEIKAPRLPYLKRIASRPLGLVSVQNAITKLELNVGLLKVKSNLGNYVWEIKEF
jgi:hypothetical protein